MRMKREADSSKHNSQSQGRSQSASWNENEHTNSSSNEASRVSKRQRKDEAGVFKEHQEPAKPLSQIERLGPGDTFEEEEALRIRGVVSKLLENKEKLKKLTE